MKKTALLLGIVLMMAAAGCSQSSEETTQSETDFVLVIDPVTVSEATEPVVTEPTTPAETITAAASETTMAPVETSTVTTETAPDASDTTDPGSILGKWQYVDGYCLNFLQGDTVELSVDFSGSMHLQDMNLYYHQRLYPLNIQGNIVTAKDENNLILKMTAMNNADAAALTGRFRLEQCQIYEDQTMDSADGRNQEYCIELTENTIQLVMTAQYRASDGVLSMIENGNAVDFMYAVQGDVLKITDETGAYDLLSRVQ